MGSVQADPAHVVAPAAATAAAAPTATAPGSTAVTVRTLYSAVGFQRLIDSVTEQVHGQHPLATLGDIVGTSPTGPTTSILDVTTWQFNFNDVGSDRRPSS